MSTGSPPTSTAPSPTRPTSTRSSTACAIEHPRIYGMILYVEQPFPYDLEAHRIDVHSVSARKPLFMDESAHDWRFVQLGRELGWTGVALKTCKTQTGALLSLCWAKAHGMTLMVQDLTNPMLAQIPARAAGRPRRHDHGRRDQRHAVLPRRLGRRGRGSSRPLPPRGGQVDLSTHRRQRASAIGSTRFVESCPRRPHPLDRRHLPCLRTKAQISPYGIAYRTCRELYCSLVVGHFPEPEE